MNPLDWIILAVYLGGILWLGTRFAKYVSTGQDFLLAGRTLSWWAIGMGIVVADIGAYDLMGLSAGAYTYGISQANFDWIGCVPAMVVAAFVFIPYYHRAGIYTVPEYLGLRFHPLVRSMVSLLWVLFAACTLGIFFHATAVFLNTCFQLPQILGVSPDTTYWGSILVTVLVVAVYTVAGGLAAITMNDVVHLVVMFVGGITVLVLGLSLVGGPAGMVEKIHAQGEACRYHLRLLVPTDAGPAHAYPWPATLLGLALVLSPAYWIGNQAIVQKCLGAKDLWNARGGMLWAALLKTAIPIMGVVPGLIALAAFPGLEDSNQAYPLLIRDLLPVGAKGLVVAAFFAALLSSVEAYASSGTTLFLKDLAEPAWRKFKGASPSEKSMVLWGRILTVLFLLAGLLYATQARRFKTIYDNMQTLFSLFQGPTLALLLAGMFTKRATRVGGIWGLAVGVVFAGILTWGRKDFPLLERLFTYGLDDPYLYVAWWSFAAAALAILLASLFTEKPDPESLRGLVYGLLPKEKKTQELLRSRLEEDE